MLRRQSSTGQKRAIGAALCVLGAACAAAAACIVAASDAAPPSSVGATVDHGQRTARGTLGRRKYDPLWWIPSLRVLTAFFSPVAAAAILRFFDRYARGSELPNFGLQTEDEYTAASDAATKRSLGALATELRERGIPPTVSEHARRRLEMLAAGGGQATGLLRSEAMQWVRHAAAPEAERAALAFGFSIGHDGRRIDEGRGSDGSSSDGEMAETSMDREPSRSALRRWDDGNKAVRQGDEPTDEPANWSNVRLIKQVGWGKAMGGRGAGKRGREGREKGHTLGEQPLVWPKPVGASGGRRRGG
jgi:hypothetical protein